MTENNSLTKSLLIGLSLPLLVMNFGACYAQKMYKPNILFILSDDHCYNCLGSLGMDNIKTPNIDKLKSMGVDFTHTFNAGSWSGAVSMASRSMLITGQYIWQVRDYVKSKNVPAPPRGATPEEEPTRDLENPPYKDNPNIFWPQYMTTAGYENYFSGKWHNMAIVQEVFDHVKHQRGGMALQTDECYNRKFIEGEDDEWQPYDKKFGGFWEGGQHWSKVLKDDAVKYLDETKNSDKPFFMYLGFNAPHDPRQAPKEMIDLYPTNEISVPENFLEKYPYADMIGCSDKLRDEQLAPFPRTEYSIKVNRQEYFASITYMDKQIGDILKKLEETGQMENTIIIYTSDHGISVGNQGFMGKQNMYDASMRVPMIIAGCGIPKGKKIDEMVYMQDIMATVMDIAGSEFMDNVDYQSLMPLINGKKGAGREEIYGAYMNLQRMIRTDRYKMILYPEIDIIRLYDIKKDPNEMVDLAKNKKSLKIMNELFVKFKEQQKIMGDTLDLDPCYNNFINKR